MSFSFFSLFVDIHCLLCERETKQTLCNVGLKSRECKIFCKDKINENFTLRYTIIALQFLQEITIKTNHGIPKYTCMNPH